MHINIPGYKVFDEIESGSFSKVYHAINLKTNESVAIKKVEKSKELESLFYNEVSIMKKANHVNIPKYIEIFDDDDYHYLVMEFIEGQTLSKIITSKGKLNENESLIYFKQIVSILTYLHEECGISHGDIKADNFIITSNQKLYILDFGFSFIIKEKIQDGFVKGSPYYMSPEVVLQEPLSDLSDIWSTGILLFYLVTGEYPFEADEFQSLLRTIIKMKPIFPKYLTNEIIDLIRKMLTKNRKSRITLEEIKNHHWYLGLKFSNDSNSDLNSSYYSSLKSLDSFYFLESKDDFPIPSLIAKSGPSNYNHRNSDVEIDVEVTSSEILNKPPFLNSLPSGRRFSKNLNTNNLPIPTINKQLAPKKPVPVLARRTITLPRRISEPL